MILTNFTEIKTRMMDKARMSKTDAKWHSVDMSQNSTVQNEPFIKNLRPKKYAPLFRQVI